jgi:hypothetical protein
MFAHVTPLSPAALAVLTFCLVLVLAFEFSNGFHDTANAVATVIYTHTLKPINAVLLSGTMKHPIRTDDRGPPASLVGQGPAHPYLQRRQLLARFQRRAEEHRSHHADGDRHHAGGVLAEL